MALKKGTQVINRKVGLLSNNKETHELVKSAFSRARELSNEITRFLYKKAFRPKTPSSEMLKRFQKTSKSAQKEHIYEYYKFNRLNHEFHHDGNTYRLNKRISRFVLDQAFFAVRNQIIKHHDLSNILDVAINLLEDENHIARQTILFLLVSGEPMKKKTKSLSTGERLELFSCFSESLQYDVFGEVRKGKKAFSLPYFHNHFSYLRNLVLKQPTINPFFKAKLEQLQRMKVTEVYSDLYHDILQDFTSEALEMNDKRALRTLIEPLITFFIATIKRRMLEVAKQKLSLKEEIQKARKKNNKNKTEKLQKSLEKIHNYTGIHSLSHNLVYSTIPEFKKARDGELELIKTSLLRLFFEKHKQFDLKHLLESLTQEYIDALLQNPTYILAKQIFSPRRARIPIKGFTLDDAVSYINAKLLYAVKKRFQNIFYAEPHIFRIFTCELLHVRDSLHTLLKVPEIKGMSIPFVEKERYTLDIPNNTLKLYFIAKENIELKIHDKDERIPTLKDTYEAMGFTVEVKSPLVQLLRNKLVLNLPFALQKVEDAPQQFTPDKDVEMGVDLGLKVFGALSIIHHENKYAVREFARYFLNQRTVFDMKFQGKENHLERGMFVKREILPSRTFFKEVLTEEGEIIRQTHLKYTNLKQKLVHIRNEKRRIQSELATIQNKCPHSFEKKSRFKHLLNQRETLDRRIGNINTELVHQISSKIIRIALHHRVCKIKFEDLRWSRHSKKTSVGHYLGFWQTHWFFSQIIQAVELQAKIYGIRLLRVNARNTSKKCAFDDSLKPIAVRSGKVFRCSHEGHKNGKYKVDADLNAARNIVMREPYNKSIEKHFVASTYRVCRGAPFALSR